MDDVFCGFWSLSFLAGTLNILAIFWDDHKNLSMNAWEKVKNLNLALKEVPFLMWMNEMDWDIWKILIRWEDTHFWWRPCQQSPFPWSEWMEWTGKLHKRHFWHVSKIPNCLYLDEVEDEDEDDNEDFIDNEDLDYEKKNVQLWSLFFGHHWWGWN